MQEVKSEDYLGRDRQTERFLYHEKEREELPLFGKAAIGVAAAAGLLSVGHRTGAIRKIAQFLDVEAKATAQAAREVFRDEQGLYLRGSEKLNTDRMKLLREKFAERRSELKRTYKKAPKDMINSREMDMVRYLRHKRDLVGDLNKGADYKKGDIYFRIEEGYRFSDFMKDVRKNSNLKKEQVNEAERALKKDPEFLMRNANLEVFNKSLNKHSKGLDVTEVSKVLNKFKDAYTGAGYINSIPEAQRLVEGMRKKVNKYAAERMHTLTKKDNAMKTAIIGHKQATVGDIVNLHESGRINVDKDLLNQMNEVLSHNKSFKDAVFDEKLYLNTKNGELFDYKSFSNIGRKSADWASNTIAGGLLHLRDFLNIKEAREKASFYVFNRGVTLSSLNGHMGKLPTEALNEDVIFVNGKFVKLFDYDAVEKNADLTVLNPKRDMHLTSSQFGTVGKMHRQMSGMMTDNETPRNPVFNFLDVFRQDKDSAGTQALSSITKFWNKDWERNKIHSLIKEGMDDIEDYRYLNNYLRTNTVGFSPRVLNNLKPWMNDSIKSQVDLNQINFSRDEDIIDIFKQIGKAEEKKPNSPHKDLVSLYRQFDRNSDRVLNRKRPIGESNPILGHHTQIRTGLDDIKQQTSMYLLNDLILNQAKGDISMPYQRLANEFRSTLKGLHTDGKINKEDLEDAESLLNYSMFKYVSHDFSQNQSSAMVRASDLVTEDEQFQSALKKMVRKTNPIYERFSEITPENKVGDEFIAMNDTGLGGIVGNMFGMKSSLKDRFSAAGDLLKQVSPFTGRKNMEDVTNLTMFTGYYPVYRLQDGLGNIGLGFSDKSMSNAFSMMANLMTKRIFPVYAGVELYKYADWKTDQETGMGLDERWENIKANDRLSRAATRTDEEIYEKRRQRMLKPGLEHWEAMPSVHIPGIGPVGMGDALNTIFAPFTGYAPLHEEDMMSYEETEEDLWNGVEPIRKSRWWFAGSKTAYRGDRIKEFAPSSFRLAHSDYEWTNTSATGEEYWGNSLLPTFENPLGGLSFLFGNRDPYWYEKKHYYDRPYMLTGELFNPNTMILGDIGNATIGKLVKPVEQMHSEYWGDPVLIYEDETSELGERPLAPIQTEISPAGRMKNQVMATPEDYGADMNYIPPVVEEDATPTKRQTKGTAKYFLNNELDEERNPTGAFVAHDMESEKTIYVPVNVAKEKQSMNIMFNMAEQPAPPDSEVKAVPIDPSNPDYQAQTSTKPRAMMNPEFAYRQDVMYRKMDRLQDPRSASWRVQEGIENWDEPLGVYKWILSDIAMGRDPYTDQMVVQRADAAYNASNRFWESELGSLGSQMSEIGRRFIRRDDGMLDQYNPIQNTMPDWMPGNNYFINFQVGDPYSKLPDGERRLPGEAYESLNELHSDSTGRYGAFDKFKILADVAPWSDEYKFWSQYLLDNLPDGDLRKEASQIRRQVSKRKEKFDFQPYKFKGNDISYDKVTVTKFLDDYTFLTEEFGDTPIRMAGMQYRKKADGVLESYFKVGDKVTLGIDEDESKREAKDTYGTMRAVVFTELGNINKQIIEKGEMVENQNDFSAPGVHARFTSNEIKKASRWESIAHFSSPLNTKFLQSRTAIEEYERDQIYGKDWSTWDNFLLDDYIIPTFQGVGRFDNPLMSMTAGATTGLVIGRFFLKGGRSTKLAGIAGGLWGLGSNMFFKHYEKKHGEAWIPERRREEAEINEYFDVLKYMKFEGLYQKAREEIYESEGIDVEEINQSIDGQKELTKQRRNELKAEKQQLFIEQPKGWEERKKEINAELNEISENFDETYLPDSVLQALYYKDQRDTTLYAVDPMDDRMKVMRAFPTKDKWFFQEFAEAGEKDREKILSLVPENERRIYKALWGYELEEQKPLEYYMEKYDIPDWKWEGWKPEYSLDDVKVKAVQQAGLDMSDFNFWDDNITASQYVPDLQEDGSNSIEGEEASNFSGFSRLKENIINVLSGQGLQDIQVSVTPTDRFETNVQIDYTEDRSGEIEEYLRRHAQDYV